MTEAKPVEIPPGNRHSLDNKQQITNLTSKVTYREAVGSLLYVSEITISVITISVNLIGKYIEDTKEQHWAAMKLNLKYLKGIINFGLIISSRKELMLGDSVMLTIQVTGIQEEPPVLEIMGRASSPISPIASSSTSETQTQGKRKHVNIFESDSDPDDPFYNSNSSITMPNLSLNISTVCSPLPLETDNDILLTSSSRKNQLQISDYNDSFTSTNSDTFITVKNKQQGTIQRYHDKITNAEIDLVNFKLGKLFFECNIPFSVVESVHFKEFCQSLRPTYKPPSRTTVSTSVLNKVHDNFCAAIKFHSNSNGEALFLESFDLTRTKETALELLISDNAENMIKMGNLTTICHLTCNSHTTNLLAKDLVLKPLIEKAKVLLKAFHGPDAEKVVKSRRSTYSNAP
ncbi:hypothetical protein QTP88_002334 [Uroleucon formosanum]